MKYILCALGILLVGCVHNIPTVKIGLDNKDYNCEVKDAKDVVKGSIVNIKERLGLKVTWSFN